MNQFFNRTDFDQLSTLFDPEANYKGYKPAVRERPDGDARVDTEKKFLHVALKYNPPEWALRLLARAHMAASEIAERLSVPSAWRPAIENATLRVLYYPVGAGTEEHTDFDLFTVNCWRDPVGDMWARVGNGGSCITNDYMPFHVGELGTMCGMGTATRHLVSPRDYEQRAIVYFASPAMATPLPMPITFPHVPAENRPEVTVTTTGAWQIERANRSRVYAKG